MPPFPTTAQRMHLEGRFLEAAYSLELSEPFRRLRVELMAVGARQGRVPWCVWGCCLMGRGCPETARGLTALSKARRVGGEGRAERNVGLNGGGGG